MKWEALLAMAGLFLLGLWLVVGPGTFVGLPETRDGAELREVRIGDQRGVLEVLRDDPAASGQPSFRLLWRNGEATEPLTRAAAEQALGTTTITAALSSPPNLLFRIFNITTWAGMAWITLGLAGQAAFFARMALQWVVSERERRSVVPPMFWYLSLAGGVMLFIYFVWRQDIVGVLGQTTGVVIYARNVRLIVKENRRARRRAERAMATDSGQANPPDPPAPTP